MDIDTWSRKAIPKVQPRKIVKYNGRAKETQENLIIRPWTR